MKQELRTRLSPRHVPDVICAVPEVPYTASGKKLEVPVKRLLSGASREQVASLGALRNPAALDALLRSVREIAPDRKIVLVFGCGGERDRGKRPLMGRVAGELAELPVLTSDNPRGEDPEAIVREIQLGTKDHEETIDVEVDRRKAIAFALDRAKPGDLVVIAGKGHEPYQIVGSQVLDFDDRQVVKEILGS